MKVNLSAASNSRHFKMPPFPRVNWGGLVWFVVVVFTSVVSGALTALVGAKAVGIILGAMFGGLAFLFLSLDSIFICQAVLIYLVVGQLQYFAHVQKAFWIPYLVGAFLLVTLPLTLMGRRVNASKSGFLSYEIALALFFILLITATILNGSGLLLIMLSIKDYLFLWVFYILITAGLVALPTVDKFWQWLPWLVPLQLPVVIYQHFVVAPRRDSAHLKGASWDAVVGLFGGDPEGGGASGAMAIFIEFAIVLVVSHWRSGIVSTRRMIFIATTGLACVALAEVKFAILMIPVGIALLYRGDLLRRPVQTLSMLMIATASAFSILVAYQMQFAYSHSEESKSIQAYVDSMVGRQTDVKQIGLTGEMGRGTALRLWWFKHGATEPVHFFLGHGVGATFSGQTATGDVARKYPFNLRRSSLTCLLWESGLLGTAALALALLLGSEKARRTAAQVERASLWRASILRASSVGLLLLLFELPYNTDFLDVPSIQFLAIVMLAYVAVMSRAQSTLQQRTG